MAAGQVSVFPGPSDQKSNVAVARYESDGDLDPTFGAGGLVQTDFGSDFDKAQGVAVQADGRILVASPFYGGQGYVSAVARYEASGALDATFGMNGIARTTIEVSSDDVGDLLLQPDGRIVAVAGTNLGPASFAFVALRFLAA